MALNSRQAPDKDYVDSGVATGTRTDLIFAAATELTISGGVVTATQGAHTIDTEADAASDDLDTINGGAAEEVLWLRAASAARTVVIKHGTGNINCPAGEDISLAETQDYAVLVYHDSVWSVVAHNTLAKAGGGLGAALASNNPAKGAALVGYDGGTTVKAALDALTPPLKQIVPMAVFGPWAIDGDGARTNGAGLVGATPTLTEQAAALAKVANNGVVGNLSAVNAGYSATYQLFPDAPVADEDYCYFGGAVPFPELALDMSATVATFDAAGVLHWEYWNGAWVALTLAHDGTSTTTADGSLSFGRDGAIAFVPPADWASTTVDGQAAYWIRCGIVAGKAANLTQVPLTNSKRHELVTPAGGFRNSGTRTITGIRLVDAAGTLHSNADVKFILHNFTTGAHSGELTFAQDVRAQVWTGLSLAAADGDVLGVVCTQEDGVAEPSNVLFELTSTLV